MEGPALTRETCFVDPDIGRAETLPARAFVDPAFLARELKTVFARHWLLAPERAGGAAAGEDARSLAEALRPRGARAPITVAGRPLFLQRGWDDDRLRAFPNVCTHAWYPLVLGPSRSHALVCGQHGRRFDCAGRFVSQPGFAAGDARPGDDLRELPAGEWGPLVFVALDRPAAALAEALAPLRESLARFPLERLALEPGSVALREVDGNWKQHAWNYMDKFHIQFVHRAPGGLADAIDLAAYATELHPWCALQWAWARCPEHGFDPAWMPDRLRDPGGRRVFALWWFVFPNLALNFYPWGLSVNVFAPVADRPDRTLFLWYHYVIDRAKYEARDRTWLNDQVDREDIDALALVRRGIRSGLAPRGRFAPAEEAGPHWLHRLVYRCVFEG